MALKQFWLPCGDLFVSSFLLSGLFSPSVPCSAHHVFVLLFQVVRTLSHVALNVMKGLMKPPLGQYLIEPSGRLKVSVGVGRD